MNGADDFGPDTIRAAAIHEHLRRLLLALFPFETPATLAAALSYELASLVASQAPDVAAAVALVWSFADTQVDQIRRLGIGKPHP